MRELHLLHGLRILLAAMQGPHSRQLVHGAAAMIPLPAMVQLLAAQSHILNTTLQYAL